MKTRTTFCATFAGAFLVPALFGVQSASAVDLKSKPVDSPPSGIQRQGPCSQVGANLCVPLDASFSIITMDSTSGSGQASPGDSCQRNDDDSGSYSLTGWSFSFYGTPFTEVWMNNNGNVSFGGAFSTFTASGFPTAGFPMIAPFWGDVDTGDVLDDFGGVMWYREYTAANDGVDRLVVTWDNVGYYNEQFDKLNTFQVILTDGNDPLIGLGNNVCFCYDDMQWTTGDASSGMGGFGGVPATVGANQGDGVEFFQIGRFDHAGIDYDGPGGVADGVSFLDNANFCFNVAGVDPNTPPIFVNPVTEFSVQLGDTLNFTTEAIGPELGETVSFTVDDSAFAGTFGYVATPGNPGSVVSTYSPAAIDELGTHTLTITATDDAATPLSASIDIVIFVYPDSISVPLCDPAVPNSTGLPGKLWGTGSDTASMNQVTLVAADLPEMSNGYFIVSQDNIVVMNPGGSAGDICIASTAIGRYDMSVQNSGTTGTVSMDLDLDMTPLQPGGPISIMMNETWNWQYWYRDTTPGGAPTSNFTNAISVMFQ